MKKIATFLIITCFSLGFFGWNIANAADQPTAVQRAFETVKGTIDDLVGAKDDSAASLELRIETLKRVAELSEAEAKDLKLQLLTLEGVEPRVIAWRDSAFEKLNNALSYYEQQRKFLAEHTKTLTLTDVKKLADAFRLWRETNYLPIAHEARDFLIIHQERLAIEIARTRWNKIQSDVMRLRAARVRGTETLPQSLTEADTYITTAQKLNDRAYNQFWSKFPLLLLSTETVTSTDTLANQTSTAILVPAAATTTISATIITDTTLVENSSSTALNSTTTTEVQNAQPTTSIKDLVSESLAHVRSAYQIFIEMSNLVRKLLL